VPKKITVSLKSQDIIVCHICSMLILVL